MLNRATSRRQLLRGATALTGGALVARQANRAPAVIAQAPSGTLKILWSGPLAGRTWDPTDHTSVNNLRYEVNVYDYLVDADENANLVPGLATEWTNIAPDTWEFKLREGVKFHDGQDFDAEDVKAAIEYASSDSQLSHIWFPGPVTGEVIDAYTVRLKTQGPAASLLYLLGMVPITCKENIEDKSTWEERPNGTGPFRMVRAERDLVYHEANEEYWRGSPKIAEMTWEYVIDPTTRLAGLISGEAHFIDRMESEQVPVVEGDANLAVIATDTVEQKWLSYKCAKPPFDTNIKLRQAIAYAIDRETIVNDILQGYGRVSDSFLAPGAFGYAPSPNNPTYDPDRAQQLLEEAGYDGSELGYGTSVGFYPKTKEYGEFIVQNLAQVGVNCQLKTMEIGALYETVMLNAEPEGFEMVDHGWMPTTVEPDNFLRALFYSPGAHNQVSDPEIDAALDAERQIIDLEERQQVLAEETLPLLMEKMPNVPLFVSQLLTGVNTRVKNLQILPTSKFSLWDVELEE
jgi:peptide/nickel transport system substrate-binding protein